MTKSRKIRSPRIAWTEEQTSALHTRYPDEKTENIAKDIGVPLAKCYAMASRMGLKKSDKFKASPASGRTNGRQGIGTRFEKGHVPANKGLRRPGWAPGRMAETQFKKGRKPEECRNYVPVGSTRIVYGNLERKWTDDQSIYPSRRWIPIHRQIWVEANGPVPPKHIVVFKPGMHTTIEEEITLDKIELISLAENMRRNTIHNLPQELKEVIQLQGSIKRRITCHERNK